MLRDFLASHLRKAVANSVEGRFGCVPTDVLESLEAIGDADPLNDLVGIVVSSPDLDTLRADLAFRPPSPAT